MEEEGYVKRYYENVKCFDIPNGINVAIFQNALKHKQKFREEYEIPLDKRVILFLGSLVPRKGVLELLEAVKSVKEAFPEAFFVIVGEGPLWKEVKQYVNQGQVRAYGFVPDSEKHKLYVMSDIFILPSKSEGQPITLLEAMASQLHIVTTAVGGIPETLAGYGFKTYIKGCSPTEIVVGLSEAFRKISDDKTISSQTLSFVQRFDWGNITKETERVYNHVVHA
jgi:glycosyltransferase involved in cell wall biosynthesis